MKSLFSNDICSRWGPQIQNGFLSNSYVLRQVFVASFIMVSFLVFSTVFTMRSILGNRSSEAFGWLNENTCQNPTAVEMKHTDSVETGCYSNQPSFHHGDSQPRFGQSLRWLHWLCPYLPALSGMWPAWYIIRHIDGDIQMWTQLQVQRGPDTGMDMEVDRERGR